MSKEENKNVLPGSDLLVNLRSRHLLQVFQVGVKQAAPSQRDPQNRLNDVADGAVIREADLLCCVHKVTPTTGRTKQNMKLKVPKKKSYFFFLNISQKFNIFTMLGYLHTQFRKTHNLLCQTLNQSELFLS